MFCAYKLTMQTKKHICNRLEDQVAEWKRRPGFASDALWRSRTNNFMTMFVPDPDLFLELFEILIVSHSLLAPCARLQHSCSRGCLFIQAHCLQCRI